VNRIKGITGRIGPDDEIIPARRRAPRKAPVKAGAKAEAKPGAEGEADFFAGIFEDETVAAPATTVTTPANTGADTNGDGETESKPRRRGRRGGRRRGKKGDAEATTKTTTKTAAAKSKSTQSRRGKSLPAVVEEDETPVETPADVEVAEIETETVPADAGETVEAVAETGKRRRRPRGGRGRRRAGKDAPAKDAKAVAERAPAVEEPAEMDTEPDAESDFESESTDIAARADVFPRLEEPMPAVVTDTGVMGESVRWDDETNVVESRAADDDDDDLDASDDDEAAAPPPGKARRMLINVADSDECRIAILQEGRLDELYTERTAATSHVGNIYKGRVTNVESSIQAAFIDFGLPQHGFLHISDLHPQYFPQSKGEPELVGRKTPRRHRPPIQHCLRRGQEVIVQVIKEGIGTKGPTLTTYISLPGRFLVMMPGMDQLGVSRKIEDDEQRRKARDLLSQLTLPKDMGFIVRTAGIDRTKRDLQRDLNYLVRLWKGVESRLDKIEAPTELYRESDLVIRTIRDVYDSTVEQVIVDNPDVAEKVREFLSIASPRAGSLVAEYNDAEPLFYRHGIEAEIDKLHSKRVDLPCGGSLVIESTEALVAIDVNSGRFRIPDNAEETAYRVNCEAVDEIARQLRLRDLGGLIICDMIDMLSERHCRDIENRLRDALKLHKERAKVLKMSRFGIIEMTRQRQRPSLLKSVFRECPRCAGTGRMKSTESVALDVMRRIRMASQRENVASVDVRVSTAVANDLLNRKRHQLTDLERTSSQSIRIHGDEAFHVDQVELACTDRRGREVPMMMEPDRPNAGQGRPQNQSGGNAQGGRGVQRGGWRGGRGGGGGQRRPKGGSNNRSGNRRDGRPH